MSEPKQAIDLVQNLIYATTQVCHRQNKRAIEREGKAARELLTALLGRKPTDEELREAVGD